MDIAQDLLGPAASSKLIVLLREALVHGWWVAFLIPTEVRLERRPEMNSESLTDADPVDIKA